MVIQVSKDFLNDSRLFTSRAPLDDAGSDLDETGTFVANIGLLEGLLLAYSVEKLLFFDFRTFPRNVSK